MNADGSLPAGGAPPRGGQQEIRRIGENNPGRVGALTHPRMMSPPPLFILGVQSAGEKYIHHHSIVLYTELFTNEFKTEKSRTQVEFFFLDFLLLMSSYFCSE